MSHSNHSISQCYEYRIYWKGTLFPCLFPRSQGSLFCSPVLLFFPFYGFPPVVARFIFDFQEGAIFSDPRGISFAPNHPANLTISLMKNWTRSELTDCCLSYYTFIEFGMYWGRGKSQCFQIRAIFGTWVSYNIHPISIMFWPETLKFSRGVFRASCLRQMVRVSRLFLPVSPPLNPSRIFPRFVRISQSPNPRG